MHPFGRCFMVCVLLLSAGCADTPDEDFSQSCHTMAKRTEYLLKEERRPFCACLAEETMTLSDTEKDAMGLIMRAYRPDGNLRAAAEGALDEGTVSVTSLKMYFEGLTHCAAAHIG